MTFKHTIRNFTLSLALLALNQVALAKGAPRIISLSPHLTEMVYDLELQKQLVATDNFSNYPPEVKDVANVGSGLQPNQELLLLYKPDIVLSFLPAHHYETVFDSSTVNVISSQPESIPALFADWRKVLVIAQADEKKRLEVEKRIDNTETQWLELVENYQDKASKSVFFLISEQPLYSVSDKAFLSQAIKSCNTQNIFSEIKLSSFIVNPEELLIKKPDVVIHGYKASHPESKQESRAIILALFKNLGLNLQAEQLISVDVDILHRPTLRFINTLPEICAAIHSEIDH